jgi:hypothetical protein
LAANIDSRPPRVEPQPRIRAGTSPLEPHLCLDRVQIRCTLRNLRITTAAATHLHQHLPRKAVQPSFKIPFTVELSLPQMCEHTLGKILCRAIGPSHLGMTVIVALQVPLIRGDLGLGRAHLLTHVSGHVPERHATMQGRL